MAGESGLMRFALMLAVAAFAVTACSLVVAAPSPTPSPTNHPPALRPTETHEPTPLLLPSETPILAPAFDRQFLLRFPYDHPTEIWTAFYPYDRVEPLLSETEYSYGMPVWSHDGSRLAFSKTEIGCPIPSSSIWISEADGSEARQVSEAIPGHVNPENGTCEGMALHPASPRSWIEGDVDLAAYIPTPTLLSLGSGQVVDVYPRDVLAFQGLDNEEARTYMGWHGFSPRGDRALLLTNPGDGPILLWMGLHPPYQATLLPPPSEFNPNLIGGRDTTSWSPDGGRVVLSEQLAVPSRLWTVDVETNRWGVVAAKTAETDTDKRNSVAWSTDGRWVAWWTDVYRDLDDDDFFIEFLDTEGWVTAREVTIDATAWGTVEGWLRSTDGRPYLVVWSDVPGGGVLLLDPENPAGDQVLIPYETLAAQIPRIKGLEPGPWQP